MEKKISVTCECEGRGFIAVADNGGVERFEVLKLVADLAALSETLVLDALWRLVSSIEKYLRRATKYISTDSAL